MQKEKLIRWAVPAAILVVLYCLPVPSGLKTEAWHMFAIFAATIAGILAAPIASGALMFIGLALTYFTGTLALGDVLKGFASGTVWMIFSAYVLSLGFVQSGLGRRIAYKMLSLFGGSSLGVAYSLGIADLVMAPAMPSVTARSGGIILPVAKSINQVLGSQPGPTGKKIGDFLIMTCFQFTPITGSLFLTGMAANPLCASLARDGLGVELTWGSWFYAALVPSLLSFALMPLLTYKFMNPDLKRTPEAKVMGREELAKMGPMTKQEKLVSVGFVLALLGWGTCLLTVYDANAIGLGLVAFLFITNAVAWKDVLNDKAARDTVVWFGAIISLAGGLDWVTTFLILGLAYIYLHYVFATTSGHVAAMYVPFASVAIAAGAPATMVAICFAIFSNFMWGITEYAGGPGPIYFGQGYFERPRFYKINFCIVTFCVAVVFSTGMVWWKLIGLY